MYLLNIMHIVPSLLCLSYSKTQEIKYNNRHDYIDIYDSVVEEVREKIRKVLRIQQGREILRSIRIIKKEGVDIAIEKIIGSPPDYGGSLWRLALFYGILCWLTHDKEPARIKDVMDTVDMIVPYGDVNTRDRVNDKLIIIDTAMKDPTKETDIWMYIEAFNAIGKHLDPKGYL